MIKKNKLSQKNGVNRSHKEIEQSQYHSIQHISQECRQDFECKKDWLTRIRHICHNKGEHWIEQSQDLSMK